MAIGLLKEADEPLGHPRRIIVGKSMATVGNKFRFDVLRNLLHAGQRLILRNAPFAVKHQHRHR